jgi:hypothetical protein
MKAVIVISDRDNVATALEPLDAGRCLEVNGVSVTTTQRIASGHKMALRPIAAGEAVIKYGSSIGLASADIPAGAHVHTHNVASSRGRGDLPPSRGTDVDALRRDPADSRTGGLAEPRTDESKQ